jgi:hypothetical protein
MYVTDAVAVGLVQPYCSNAGADEEGSQRPQLVAVTKSLAVASTN